MERHIRDSVMVDTMKQTKKNLQTMRASMLKNRVIIMSAEPSNREIVV